MLCCVTGAVTWRPSTKDFALLVGVYDEGAQQVNIRFLDMPACNNATGEGMYDTSIASIK